MAFFKKYWFFAVILPVCLYISGCATAPYHPAPVAGLPAPTGGIFHQVHKNETLWRIAQAYGIDVDEIINANNLSGGAKINSGQQLFIPGATAPITVETDTVKLNEKDIFVWPTSGDIVSYFNQNIHGARNKGIDIKAFEGAKVVASKGGKVIFCCDNMKGLGRVIIIDHLDGFSTVYARNLKNLVRPGDSIGQNQVVALAGSSGRGTGTYLHFEIRRRHKPQNPLYYLP